MESQNAILMTEARSALSGKWSFGVKITFIYFLLTIAFSLISNFVLSDFMSGFVSGFFQVDIKEESWENLWDNLIRAFLVNTPLSVGLIVVFLKFIRKEETTLKDLFTGYKHFIPVFKTSLIVSISIFLWSLLLIIPGIIALVSYSMCYFILADNPKLSTMEIMAKSKKMMLGNKWEYFFLSCRFIGWGLVSIATLGIGLLWLIPYVQTSQVLFYENLKQQQAPTGSDLEQPQTPASLDLEQQQTPASPDQPF
ncbi:DUF975 family protein [Candidatus Haliotispira prima]|uniref:DUF975 family protein n=1 Tax=Candidatus Haliotispira prima TaxID=3034016 RepID=A0ABY8MED0_9SPIO|nr:DUF975 family protein [Candidatus Haliotispira prima]